MQNVMHHVRVQIRSLRSKLRDSRGTAEALAGQLSSVKIASHEREAELSAVLRASGERSLPSLLGAQQACLAVCLCVQAEPASACLSRACMSKAVTERGVFLLRRPGDLLLLPLPLLCFARERRQPRACRCKSSSRQPEPLTSSNSSNAGRAGSRLPVARRDAGGRVCGRAAAAAALPARRRPRGLKRHCTKVLLLVCWSALHCLQCKQLTPLFPTAPREVGIFTHHSAGTC